MKFLVDQMLGTLAKWLRLCGLDTFYATQEVSDDELLKIAKNQDRILVTRDKELHNRAKKDSILSLFISSIDLTDQLHLVFQSIPRIHQEIRPLTRCSLCNTKIDPIEKQDVKDRVPKRIFNQHIHFWQCPSCHQIYWKGTHYQKILDTIHQLQEQTKKYEDY